MDTLQNKLVAQDFGNRLSLGEIANVQTVLLVRTGVGIGLNAPVSLENLISLSLPPQRTDLAGIDTVRIYLKNAIQLIIDVGKRETLTTSQPRPLLDTSIRPKMFHTYTGDPQVSFDFDAWAGVCIQEADKYGYDHYSTWHAIRRVQARLVGEGVFEPGFECFVGSRKP
jgi:hypothetical protein